MRPITISLSPNVLPADVRGAWRVLLSPWLWRQPDAVRTVEHKLTQRFNRNAVLVSSGRAAIYRLLESYGIGKGDEVIIQAFTCLAVPTAIQWTGATPVYADIRSHTYNLDPADVRRQVSSRTRAIIVQHTFGIPGPIEELQNLAAEHNIILIEDCAHGLGGQHKNQPLGTFGDAAILSFGRDKTISCVFGGAIISRDQDMIARVRRTQNKLPHPPYWWTKQQLLHPIVMSLVIPLYFTAGIGKALLVASQKVRFLSMAVTSREKHGGKPAFLDWRMSPALAYLLNRQLDQLDSFTKHRRSIARRYQQDLSLSFKDSSETDPNWLRVPVHVKDTRQILKAAAGQHMLLGDWYQQPVTPSATTSRNISGYHPGSCPNAEHAANHTVNLPTYPRMTGNDATRVIDFMKSKHEGSSF